MGVSISVTGLEEVRKVIQILEDWSAHDHISTVDRAVIRMADGLKDTFSRGLNADGSPMKPLAESTLNGPYRARDGNPTIRSFFGATPMNATGKTYRSIKMTKPYDDRWEIGADDALAAAIIASNANPSHSGVPFAGDTPKPIRDPLAVTDAQEDILIDQIVTDLERLLA